MNSSMSRSRTGLILSTLGCVLALGAWISPAYGGDAKYEGVKKCKNCHRSKSKGNQFGKWEESKHAKAYEVLATEEAKKVAKDKGIEDPQTSDECLKCHIAGHGVDKAQLGRKYKVEDGVGCEACHGPGSAHAKARLSAAAEVEDDEEPAAPAADMLAKEITKGDEKLCLKCHNKESPTFKEFKYEEQWKKIEHSKPK